MVMKNAGCEVFVNTPNVSVIGPFRRGDVVRRLVLEVNSPSSLTVGFAVYTGNDKTVAASDAALSAYERLTPRVSGIEGSDPDMQGVWLASNNNFGAGMWHAVPLYVEFEADESYLYVYSSCPGSATVFVSAEGEFLPEVV
jgi:hypothetical protein